jgi:hypothetical protein
MSHCSFTGSGLSSFVMYNCMLKSNSETLSRLLKADLSIQSRDPSCWIGLRCFLPCACSESTVLRRRLWQPISL